MTDSGGDHAVVPPLTLRNLWLVTPDGARPVFVATMVIDEEGIAVKSPRDVERRLLPWSAITAHAVESWSGGPFRRETSEARADSEPELEPIGPGPLLSLQTQGGTYRLIHPGGDVATLGKRVDSFAVLHHGPSAHSTVTRATGGPASTSPSWPWPKIRPWALLVAGVVVATLIVLILLQSAGAIHLPFLGGPATSAPPTPRPASMGALALGDLSQGS